MLEIMAIFDIYYMSFCVSYHPRNLHWQMVLSGILDMSFGKNNLGLQILIKYFGLRFGISLPRPLKVLERMKTNLDGSRDFKKRPQKLLQIKGAHKGCLVSSNRER